MSDKRKNLFIPGKLQYARGEKRPDVECILCAIVEGSDKVARLEVHRSELFVATLNLYPYAPGHMMIFPKRHITDPRMLDQDEVYELHIMQGRCLDALDEVYSPHAYNVGYNIGEASGASIAHIHLHIVPRYRREIGFIEVISGTKIIVEDPNISLARMREAFEKYGG